MQKTQHKNTCLLDPGNVLLDSVLVACLQLLHFVFFEIPQCHCLQNRVQNLNS